MNQPKQAKVITMTWNAMEPKTTEVKQEDFWKPAKEIEHEQGLKVLAWGDAEVGKTFLCLSAPPPIYIVDTEYGTAPVIRHFKDKEIYVFEAAVLDPATSEPDPDLSLKKVERALTALKKVDKGTICIDSGTDVWDILTHTQMASALDGEDGIEKNENWWRLPLRKSFSSTKFKYQFTVSHILWLA